MSWLSKRAVGIILFCSILLVCLVAVNGWTGSKCYVCELDLSDFATTRYTIVTKDKKTLETCSFYCAAKAIQNHKARKISAVDFNTGKKINAKKAIYVIGSAVKEKIHNKSWLAFRLKGNARSFILKNGGMSRPFKKALKAMSARISDENNIPKLLKTRQSPGCSKCHTS